MTVGELMARLGKYKAGRPVLVDGYEGGFDVPVVEEVMVVRPDRPEERKPWQGRYARQLETEGLVFVAVVVGRDGCDKGSGDACRVGEGAGGDREAVSDG